MTLVIYLALCKNNALLAADSAYNKGSKKSESTKLYNLGKTWWSAAGSVDKIQHVSQSLAERLKKRKVSSPNALFDTLAKLDKKFRKENEIPRGRPDFIFVIEGSSEGIFWTPQKELRMIEEGYEAIGESDVAEVLLKEYYTYNSWESDPPRLREGIEAVLRTYAGVINQNTTVRLPVDMLRTNPLKGPYRIGEDSRTWKKVKKYVVKIASEVGSLELDTSREPYATYLDFKQ